MSGSALQRSRELWRRFARDRLALASSAFLLLVVFVCLCAPLLPLRDPNVTDLGRRLVAPGSSHGWLGTDQLGRDVLARLVFGARASLAVGALGALVAALAGTLVGLASGYYGGRVDAVLMRCVDVVMAFPYVLLALAIVAALGPSLKNATIAVAIVNIPFFARAIRGKTLSLKSQDFVAAARVSGLSGPRILFSELLPNVSSTLLVTLTTTVGWMILETAGLSFLGLGAQPPQADLGGMLGQGREYLAAAPHVSLLPGALIFCLVVALNGCGDGLRDALGRPSDVTATHAAEPAAAAAAASEASDATPLLQIENLSVRIAGKTLLESVSLTLAEGQALGLVGESGSGKTLLVESLLGLRPEAELSGKLTFRGQPLPRASAARRAVLCGRRVGLVPQDPLASLHPLLRAGSQVAEALVVVGKQPERAARRRTIELFGELQLGDPERCARALPHQLSGGMRQRVAVAMALCNQPQLLVADEPTTALDVTVQAELLELIKRTQRERGMSLLFISHDLGLVSQLCDQIVVLKDGRVVEKGETRRLISAPSDSYTRELVSAARRLEAEA